MSGSDPTGDPGPAPAILQVLPALKLGGVERGTVEIAQAIAAAGWRAVVTSSGGPLAVEIERAGGEHITLPLDEQEPPRDSGECVGRLRRLIREREISIVHARSRAPAWSAWYAARQTGARFVTTFHGFYSARTALKRRYNAVMTRGERVIAVSAFIADHVAGVYGVPQTRLRTIPRGIDPAVFDPARVSAGRVERLRGAWQAGDDGPVVVLPGRLSRWKGHETAVAAMARLDRTDVRCVFVGAEAAGGYGAAVGKAIDDAGLAGRVRFAGPCDDMPAAYLAADVVVVPSTEPESFGRVAVEAQAMGRSPVAAEHGGTRETVVDGETGWLVPPGDAGALARAISGALEPCARPPPRDGGSRDAPCARPVHAGSHAPRHARGLRGAAGRDARPALTRSFAHLSSRELENGPDGRTAWPWRKRESCASALSCGR